MTFSELQRVAYKAKDRTSVERARAVIQKYAPKLKYVPPEMRQQLAEELSVLGRRQPEGKAE